MLCLVLLRSTVTPNQLPKVTRRLTRHRAGSTAYCQLSLSKLTRPLLRNEQLVTQSGSPAVRCQSTATSATPAPKSFLEHISVAPAPIRVALVGTSVGLCTPIYATAGAVQIWYHVLPKTRWGQLFKYLLSIVCGGSVVVLVKQYVFPFFMSHSELILPFAAGNGLAASFWYTLAELTVGIEGLLIGINVAPWLSSWFSGLPPHISLAGPVIGVLTAITAPFIWPYMFKLCWSPDMQQFLLQGNYDWISDIYDMILVPVGIPVGLFSGIAMQAALKPAIAVPTSSGSTWRSRALPVLAALAGLGAAYFVSFNSEYEAYTWESRIDIKTGNFISYNVLKQEASTDPGLAESSRLKRYGVHVLSKGRLFFTKIPTGGASSEHSNRNSNSVAVKGKEDETEMEKEKEKGKRSQSSIPGYRLIGEKVIPKMIEDRELLFQLVDIIVRYKYLSDQLSSDTDADINKHEKLQEEMEQLQTFTLNNYGFADLSRLYKDTLVAVVARRRWKCSLAKEGDKHAVEVAMKKLWSHACNNKVTRGSMSLGFLYKNTEALEEELSEKLGYRVTPAEEDAMLAELKQKIQSDRLWWNGKLIVGAMALAGLGSWMTSSPNA